MLTPQDITDKVFIKAVFGGYDMTGVDDFLEAVVTDYTALYKENAILKGKLKVLVEKVEEYRSTEDAMRMALLAAQRTGDEITSEANKKRDEMLRTADLQAKNILADVAKRKAEEELRLNVAAKETAKFIEVSQMILRKHSEFLTKLETARRVVQPQSAAEDDQTAMPQTTREEQIADTAGQIDSALERLTGVSAQPPAPSPAPLAPPVTPAESAPVNVPAYEDEGEPTRPYVVDDSDESITPRPRFDFGDLKFGSNFNSED